MQGPGRSSRPLPQGGGRLISGRRRFFLKMEAFSLTLPYA